MSLVQKKDLKKLLIVVNIAEFFISHRLPIALAARERGYEVHIATAPSLAVRKITDLGFTHHEIPFERSGQNPLREVYVLITLCQLFSRIQPDLVHLITIKPVLYGGIAARITGVSSVVAAVSGLGTVFDRREGLAGFRRRLVSLFYRFSFRQQRLAVIFQNCDDRDTLLDIGALKSEQARMIRGSGVCLAEFPFVPEPEGVPVVVMAARLLRDKGVLEFVEAARQLKMEGVNLVMRLIGSPDPDNPGSVTQSEVDLWANEGVVEILGNRTDIASQYAAANIVCLPSFYGEGLPKSLVEAAACGRAVITTDHPGCRDAIEPEVTGVLVPVRDTRALVSAIRALINTPEKRAAMGSEGRRLAEEAFAIESIVEQHLEIYQELLA